MSPDITMCSGEGCPAKDLCYRYTAKPNPYRQSYFVDPPYKDDECDYFWGDNQEQIWNSLKDIVKGKDD